MKWPIIEKTTDAPEPAAASNGGSDGQPMGINREIGEGGFYARIAFQDTVYPWRYAFIQQHRGFDPSDFANDIDFFDSGAVARQTGGQPIGRNNGANFQGHPGQQSLWNDYAGQPFSQVVDITGKAQNISQGRVLNWAEESTHCQSVPIGSIVWMRGGENYPEQEFQTPRDDYTFTWARPIWAKITGGHKSSEGDNATDDQYQWIEQYRARDPAVPGGVKWADAINPRKSDPQGAGVVAGNLNFPAREINANIAVPYGTIVELIPSQAIAYNADGTLQDQEWLFSYTQGADYCDVLVSGDSTTDTISTAAGNLTVADKPAAIRTANIVITAANSLTVYRSGVYQIDWPVSVYGIHAGDPPPYHYTVSLTLLLNGAAIGSQEGHFQWQDDPARKGDGFAQCSFLFQLALADLPAQITFLAVAQNAPQPDHWYLGGGDVVDSNCRIVRLSDYLETAGNNS